MLIAKGLTTYEYILSQREKQAFEDGKTGMAESMDTAKDVAKCMCCCKQNRVRAVEIDSFNLYARVQQVDVVH